MDNLDLLSPLTLSLATVSNAITLVTGPGIAELIQETLAQGDANSVVATIQKTASNLIELLLQALQAFRAAIVVGSITGWEDSSSSVLNSISKGKVIEAKLLVTPTCPGTLLAQAKSLQLLS